MTGGALADSGSVGAEVRRCLDQAAKCLQEAGESPVPMERVALAEAWMKLAGNLVCFKPELERA